ncbi:hypothetical protein Dimus_019247 [Dionaea muscipula]
MSNRGGASSRVSIPDNVRKTIQDIKEVTGKHSEEDIYAMLKECSMEPNETIARLLYLDTFHEVKSKRDKRKEVQNLNSLVPVESRRKPGLQGTQSRGGRGNFLSPNFSHESRSGRSATFRKENGVEGNKGRAIKPLPTSPKKEVDTKVLPLPIKSTLAAFNSEAHVLNCSPRAGEVIQLPSVDSTNLAKGDVDSDVGVQKSLLPQLKAQLEHTPSAPDPLLPSSDSGFSLSIGTFNSDVRAQSTGPAENKNIAPLMMDGELLGIGKDRPSENLQLSAYPVQEHSLGVNSPQQVTASSGVAVPSNPDFEQKPANAFPSKTASAFEAPSIQVEGSSNLSASKASLTEESTQKLEKLRSSDGHHVIIPHHIQVPEAVKNIPSFGSFDASFVDGVNLLKDLETCKDSRNPADLLKDETFQEPSSSNQDASSIAHDGNFADQQQVPDMPEEASLPENQVTFDMNIGDLGADQLKHKKLPAMRPPYPVVQNTSSFGFGFLPHMLGIPLAQVDELESQARVSNSTNGNPQTMTTSASASPPIQSLGVGQSSISLPSPLPLFRPPYPHTYIPYSHYYSPFYVPPAVHQYFGHSGFSPQLMTGTMFLQQPGVASGMNKVSPASYKPGANPGSTVHVPMPFGYGVYNFPQLGYSPSATITSGNSNRNEELVGSSLKDINACLGLQSEVPSVWIPSAAGRETSRLPVTSFFNLPPHWQHAATLAPQSSLGTVYSPLQTNNSQPIQRQTIHSFSSGRSPRLWHLNQQDHCPSGSR